MSDKNFSNSNLFPVSIGLLYDGMEVQEDIYDADATMLIANRGSLLSTGSIEKIKALNAGRDIIRVSGHTYKILIERAPPSNTESRKELEDSTGYTNVKDETFRILGEVASKKTVQPEDMNTVSEELSHRLEATNPSTILSLINALAPVDEYLQRHCVNVSLLNGLIGKWLGLKKQDVDRLILVGLLHDCGKALIPHQVLNAPRKLTGVEFEVIKMHPVYSYELLSEFPEAIRRASRGHHEKINGFGYPDRLTPATIPADACITAVSDIYDAMVSQRAYKKPRSPFSIMAVLNELVGSELDGRLVGVFNKNMPLELIDRPVTMSDGAVGIVKSFDPNDIEYPVVEVDGHTIKTGSTLYCTSMYTAD